MKHLKTIFAFMLMVVLSIGQVWGASPVTISPTQALNDGGVSPITVACAKGDGTSAPAISSSQLRLYQAGNGKTTGNTITFSSTATITKIEFDFVSGKTASNGSFSVGSYDDATTTWTGSTSSLTLTVTGTTSGTRIYINSMKVYYETGSTPTCATPTFNPASGEIFSDYVNVAIACETEEATIYYTTNGNDPTTSSSVYSTALKFTETTTLKAMAAKSGSNNSAVATATYTKMIPVSGNDIDFESDLAAYVGWDFVNFTKTDETIDPHGGSYFAKTNGTNTASVTTKAKVANPGTLTYYISKIGTNTNANSKWKARVSSDGTTWTIVGTEYAAGVGVTAGTWNECTADLTSYSNVYVQVYYDGTSAVRTIDDISLTTVTAGTVATPSISGETPFVTSTTVTLACTTVGASIYYTTNGSDPTSSSTLYSKPFELNAGATVKAIAIKGSSSSSVASKEFTKVTSYTTLADIFATATEVGNTATDIYVTFDSWKISAKNNNNAFLTDGTNGAVIYGSSHGFNAGDVLTGTAACKVQLYNGFAELTSLNSSTTGLTVTPGTVGDPVVKTWSQLSAVNTGALVKLENLTYDGTNLSDGTNTIPTYTTFYTASFENGKSYNLSGIYQYYNTAGQILPRNADDVEQIVHTYTVTYNNAPDHGTLTIKNDKDVVTSGSAVNEGTELTIVTSPDEGYKLAGVTVNGSAYTETTLTLSADVTIAATFELNQAPLVTTYILSEIGVETSHLNGERVGDKVTLPSTATECSKTFVGWTTKADFEDGDESLASFYEAGAEYTLAANNKLYAVYATENVATPTDHALGSLTVGGTSGNTASEGYTYTSNKTNDKAGYTQDSGTKDADIVHLQIKAASQIINEEPSAIIVTAHLGAGADRDELTYPVNAVLVDAEGNNVGDPVVLTNSIPDKNGADFSANLPTANYADVRGVKISHKKEDGWNVRYYSMSFKYQTGGTTYSNYSTDCQAQVKTPTFSPAAGTYTEVKNVTISSETTGATIYYTTNGDEPTTSSTLYEGAITVDASKTLKAIAVKSGMTNSAVATAAYEINLPVILTTMDQIFAAATAAGGTATDANIKFNNWVVSGVATNGKNVYVTDGTKGFIIFDNGGAMGFAVGNVLSGTVACKVQLYNGAAELTTLSSSTQGLSVATGGTISAASIAPADLAGVNTGALIALSNWKYDGSNLTDGATSVQPYTTLYAYDEAFTKDTYYNVTGIYLQFNNKKEILPRSAADIEEISLEDPEISYTPATATIELGQSLPGTTFANPHELAISYSSNNESVATVSNTGVIALGSATGTAVITASFAGDATYAAANVTYTITVNPASVSENVVVLAEHNSKFYAMTTTITNETAVPVEVEYDGTKVTVAKDADKDAIQWTKKTIGENITFQTKDEDKLYLKGTSGGATLSLNATACNWAWDGTNNCYVTGTRGFIYRISTNGFKNYGVSNLSNADYVAPQVIVIDPANIVVTEKADAELAYTPAEVTLTVGGEFTPAVLGYAEGFDGLASVTYASNNEDVATVEADGTVSLVENATGTATITATFAGNTNYQSGSASYTITVNEVGDDLTGTWVVATSVSAGDRIIIANVAAEGAIKTMGAQNGNYREQVASTVDSDDKLTPAEGTKVFTLVDASSINESYEGFALRASNGNYLSAASSSSNNMKEVANIDGNAVWRIEISEGVAAIVAQGGYTRKVIRHNSKDTRFSCYAENNTMADVVIYKHVAQPIEPDDPEPVYNFEEVRTGLEPGRFYTICMNKNILAVRGASFWGMSKRSSTQSIAYLEEEVAPFDAGKPFIFYATAPTLELAYGEESTNTPIENGALRGTLTGMDATALNGVSGTVYLMYQNALHPLGTNNHLDANRAYLLYNAMDVVSDTPEPAPGRRVRSMPMQGNVATSIEDNSWLNNDNACKIMIDGQLYILRGDKLYNMTGCLVK